MQMQTMTSSYVFFVAVCLGGFILPWSHLIFPRINIFMSQPPRLSLFTFHRYMVDATEVDEEINLSLFQNSIDACKAAGLQHIVIFETPNTKETQNYINIVKKSGIAFTYIQGKGDHINTKNYNFEKGIQSQLDVVRTTPDQLMEDDGQASNTKYADLPREDLAAVGIQALMSLDWTQSRCLKVSAVGPAINNEDVGAGNGRRKKMIKSDGEWCMHSSNVAELLVSVE